MFMLNLVLIKSNFFLIYVFMVLTTGLIALIIWLLKQIEIKQDTYSKMETSL